MTDDVRPHYGMTVASVRLPRMILLALQLLPMHEMNTGARPHASEVLLGQMAT